MVDQGPEGASFSWGCGPSVFLNCSQSTPAQFGSPQNATGDTAVFQNMSEEHKYQEH